MNHTLKKFLLLIISAQITLAAHANPGSGAHSFGSCSFISSERLTLIQLHARGLTLDLALETLPELSPEAARRVSEFFKRIQSSKLLDIYSETNAAYAACAKAVYKRSGIPVKGSRDSVYYHCAGENKWRYEVLLAIQLGGTEEEVLPQLSELRRLDAQALYKVARESGIESAYSISADELKYCMNKV